MTLLRFGLQDRLNQILSSSVKELALFKKKRFKKIEFEVSAGDERLLLSKLGQTEFGETLGINSVSKDISFGSFSTSLPETSAKELKCVLLPL